MGDKSKGFNRLGVILNDVDAADPSHGKGTPANQGGDDDNA